MPSLLVTGTLQALALGAISNVLAQIITARQEDVSYTEGRSSLEP